MKLVDITGQRFGMIEVKAYAGSDRKKRRYQCSCDCGTQKVIAGSDLRSGKVVSCGCLRRAKFKAINDYRHQVAQALLNQGKTDAEL